MNVNMHIDVYIKSCIYVFTYKYMCIYISYIFIHDATCNAPVGKKETCVYVRVCSCT